jgi:hypothetical protein
VKSFKDFINERRGSYINFRKADDGTLVRRTHRHTADIPDPTMGANRLPGNANFIPDYNRSKPVLTGDGNKFLSLNQARAIAKKHGLNLGTITKNGKTLRGTRPKEVLFLNPDQKSPFPYIKKVVK